MGTTDLVTRSTLDLTRAPDQQWNEEMLALIAKSVFRGIEVTKSQLYYCLSVAEAIGLNPMIGEVYFIPSRSKDAKGPALIPYVGRNGLVKKAAEKNAYFESETVHENDRFRMARKRDGTVEVTHSYGAGDRGAIVGAYAFLHFRNGDRPAFFYAKLEEYLPTYDADWKMKASPWGNQRSAMVEKCAMIGAGRKRLDLGNVLADGEVAIVQQMQAVGPEPPHRPAGEFDFAAVTQDDELAARLKAAAVAAGWPPAKCEMLATGMSDEELRGLATRMELEAERRRDTPAPAEDEIADAEVVPGLTAEQEQHADALRARIADLEERMRTSENSDEIAELEAEVDHVGRELGALSDPQQDSLL